MNIQRKCNSCCIVQVQSDLSHRHRGWNGTQGCWLLWKNAW